MYSSTSVPIRQKMDAELSRVTSCQNSNNFAKLLFNGSKFVVPISKRGFGVRV